jgi:hypothetical protein
VSPTFARGPQIRQRHWAVSRHLAQRQPWRQPPRGRALPLPAWAWHWHRPQPQCQWQPGLPSTERRGGRRKHVHSESVACRLWSALRLAPSCCHYPTPAGLRPLSPGQLKFKLLFLPQRDSDCPRVHRYGRTLGLLTQPRWRSVTVAVPPVDSGWAFRFKFPLATGTAALAPTVTEADSLLKVRLADSEFKVLAAHCGTGRLPVNIEPSCWASSAGRVGGWPLGWRGSRSRYRRVTELVDSDSPDNSRPGPDWCRACHGADRCLMSVRFSSAGVDCLGAVSFRVWSVPWAPLTNCQWCSRALSQFVLEFVLRPFANGSRPGKLF